MNEHGIPDPIDEVLDHFDAHQPYVTNHDEHGTHTRHWWTKPAPGAMTAIALDTTDAGPVEISATEPTAAIAHRVGDPLVNRISHLHQVAVWVGGNSVAHRPVNAGATTFLRHLLADVRDGRYVATAAERDHARDLLASDDLPVIHGPCLVTGVVDNREIPAPLDDQFRNWFTSLLAELAHLRESLVHVGARQLGIPPDRIGGTTVVSLP